MAGSTLHLEDEFKLLGTRPAGRILIESVVARGGFGLVYRGRHEALGVPVAVKLLLTFSQYAAPIREDFSKRFEQEARLIARLTHPASVRLLDHGVDLTPDGELTPWMALEWLDGTPLNLQMRARGDQPYPVGEALALIRPALEALAEAHALGIAHRDITPGNVFVSDRAEGPRTRLIDFGIAREMEENAAAGMGFTATRSTIHAFTMRYAAPEQVSHARTGPWTDVHAVGLLLTQMLTGCAPYPGTDETERVAQVLSPVRPTPAGFGLDVGALEAVIARCVALKAVERFPNAGALLEALDAAVAQQVAPPARASLPAVTAPAAPFEPATVIYHSVPSGLVTATEVLRRAPPRDPRVLWSVLVVALCVLGITVVSMSSSPRPVALVASVPRSQTAGSTVDSDVVEVRPAVLQQLVAPPVALPLTPRVEVAQPAVRSAPEGGHRAALHRSTAPGVTPRGRQELPRCRSLHERNCRP